MSLPPAKAVPLIPPFLPAPHAAAACIAVPPRRLRIFPLTGKQKPPRSLPTLPTPSQPSNFGGVREIPTEDVCDSGIFSQLFLKSGFRRAGRAKRMGKARENWQAVLFLEESSSLTRAATPPPMPIAEQRERKAKKKPRSGEGRAGAKA